MIVYGSETCWKCKQKCKELDSKGIIYTYIDIASLDKDSINILCNTYGTNLPIII
jgi:arsenate reductase-like glutaredoxin family protein